MLTPLISAGAAAVGLSAFYLAPLFKQKRTGLSVLLIGRLRWTSADGKRAIAGLSVRKLERLFKKLSRQQIPTILPQHIQKDKAPQTSEILLVFEGGYKTLYTRLFPLLKKYGLKATVALSVQYIGQYDAWNAKSPWQDLLTASQLKEMAKSGHIAFISQLLNGKELPQTPEDARYQLEESKTRLKNLYHIQADAIYFPGKMPEDSALLAQAAELYPLQIGRQTGSNYWPLGTGLLHVRRLNNWTNITRLIWKLKRP